MKELVIMFARWPAPGQVKTRLAQAVGPEVAASLYQAFIDDLVDTMRPGPHDLVLAITPAASQADFAARYGLPTWIQPDGDLGHRMSAAFSQAFDSGYRPVVLIGSDVPHMTYARVRAAMAALGSADVVLGATEDGGYDLVGLRAPQDIFSGMRWSHDQVLNDTLQRCEGLRYLVLQPNFDIDTVSDLVRLAEVPHLLGKRTHAAFTAWVHAQKA